MESMYYEHKKHDGSLEIIGVNTFLPKEPPQTEETVIELIRSTEDEKKAQITPVEALHGHHAEVAAEALTRLQ